MMYKRGAYKSVLLPLPEESISQRDMAQKTYITNPTILKGTRLSVHQLPRVKLKKQQTQNDLP